MDFGESAEVIAGALLLLGILVVLALLFRRRKNVVKPRERARLLCNQSTPLMSHWIVQRAPLQLRPRFPAWRRETSGSALVAQEARPLPWL